MTPKNPLIGERVLNVHRQACDICQADRLAYHGTVLEVEEGPSPVIWVQFDGLMFRSAQTPQDLAFVNTWPAPESRNVMWTRSEVARLSGHRLDWAVGMAMDLPMRLTDARQVAVTTPDAAFRILRGTWMFSPTSNGEQAWWLVREHRMDLNFLDGMGSTGSAWESMLTDLCGGDTPEEAVCRAFVTSKLGPLVYLPPVVFE